MMVMLLFFLSLFCIHLSTPPVIYSLSLHDALPIWFFDAESQKRAHSPSICRSHTWRCADGGSLRATGRANRHQTAVRAERSEEHTSELQSRPHLVCRLLLEKKKTENDGLLHCIQMN